MMPSAWPSGDQQQQQGGGGPLQLPLEHSGSSNVAPLPVGGGPGVAVPLPPCAFPLQASEQEVMWEVARICDYLAFCRQEVHVLLLSAHAYSALLCGLLHQADSSKELDIGQMKCGSRG